MLADPDARASSVGGELLPEPSGWSDALAGTDGPRYWDRLLTGEQARLRRYGGRVTIVLVEIVGFEELATWVGSEAAVQYFSRLSRVLAGQVRSSDHIARVGRNRFAILLIQTDEIRTLNFIDRVLKTLRSELGEDAQPIHVGIGWASPEPRGDLTQAMATAEERLQADFFRTRG